jgi:phosphoribosyl 1,2-cyclic phosphodiesterase
MRLIVLASGSTGNGYLLTSENETLLIEAGVKLSRVKKALHFNMSSIAGCIVSHRHKDHSGYIKEYMDMGITIIANSDVFAAHNIPLDDYRVKIIQDGHGYKVGGFKILPIPANHDVPCHAFIIDHFESGKVLFMTDTFMSEHSFPGLNHIILEANYADDILDDNIRNGRVHPSMRSRLMQTHMEISTCINVLKASDLTNIINIVLCHLSDGNSDEERFIREVREATGKQVYAAKKGMELNFNINPY